MNFKFLEHLILYIQDFSQKEMGVKLTLDESRWIAMKLISYKQIMDKLNKEIRSEILSIASYRNLSPLDKIYTVPEAAQKWGISTSYLRNSLTIYEKFNELIEQGWVRKSGSSWLLTDAAMVQVFGEREGKSNESQKESVSLA